MLFYPSGVTVRNIANARESSELKKLLGYLYYAKTKLSTELYKFEAEYCAGDNIIDHNYEISKRDFINLAETSRNIVEKSEKDLEERAKGIKTEKVERLNALFKVAKDTGKPQVISSELVPFDRLEDESNLDIVTRKAMPNGTVKIFINLTY